MPFAYYSKLSARQRRIYDRSNGVSSILLPQPERFAPLLRELEGVLGSGNRPRTEEHSQALVSVILRVLKCEVAKVKVLEKRPSKSWGELHGLYERERGSYPVVTVWMRTAKRIQVVAFKTYLRTLLHEVCHHLDYTLLRLEDSFHTEGFYQRESSLLKQLYAHSVDLSSQAFPTPRFLP